MSSDDRSEAERQFVEHVNALGRDARRRGAAADCAVQLAAILAENEAECSRMERETAEQDDEASLSGRQP